MACFLAVFDIDPFINPVTGEKEYPEVAFQSGVTRWVVEETRCFIAERILVLPSLLDVISCPEVTNMQEWLGSSW